MRSENLRYISFKQWWLGGTAVAAIATIMSYFLTGGHVTPNGTPWWILALFLGGGLEAGVFIFWLAARNAGHDGIPIQ